MDYRKLIFPVLLMLANFVPNAHAFSQGQFPASSAGNVTTFGNGTVGGGTLGSGTVSFASDGTVLSKGPVSFSGAAGSKVTADLTAKVSKAAVGKAVANFAFTAVPLLGFAVSLYNLYDELGFGKTPAGLPTKTVTSGPWIWTDDPATSYSSGQAVCRAIADWQGRTGYNGHLYVAGSRFPDAVFRAPNSCDSPSAGGSYCGGCVRQLSGPTTIQPVTRQDFEDAVAAKNGWPTSSSLGRVVQTALDSGQVAQAEPQALTGPTATPGEKTTTTNPDGTTTTTTTTNNYLYSGPNVTVTTTTVTQNFDTSGAPAGNPTVTKSEPAPKAEPEPQKDLCEKNPDILACAKLDTPDATPVLNTDLSVSITPDSGWGPASGTCPAPRPLALHGVNADFSWQPFCDFASGIRGVILAVAWLMAAGSVIGMARRE